MVYKDILDNIEWSFSTLHQYEQCPYSFYEKKLDGTEINEGNFYSDIGGFVHEINAQIFDGTLSIDNAIDYFIDNYENNVVYTAKQSTMENKYNQAIDYLAAFDTDKLFLCETNWYGLAILFLFRERLAPSWIVDNMFCHLSLILFDFSS